MMLAPANVRAQADEDGVQVAIRAASFLMPAPSGIVTAAIVYDPGEPGSEREARAIEHSLASQNRIKDMVIRPHRVPVGALDQLAGARVAFVTQGTNYRQVGSAAGARSILTISFDAACARAGYCVLAIATEPKVQIAVSRSATAAARLHFNSSFLMLVKEI